MSTVPLAIRRLAWQLLASDGSRVLSADAVAEAVRACETLRLPQTKLVGAGFSSLLSRALVMATRRAPALGALRVEHDGSLAGLKEFQHDPAPTEAEEPAGVVLLAELLGVLIAIIGERMTLIMVGDAWADSSIIYVDLDSEYKR